MVHRVARLLPLVALAVAAALVVVLALQNRALRAQAESLCERATEPYVGLVVPTFQALTLAGDSVTIGEAAPGELQLLFVFNTRSHASLETLPGWTTIVSELNRGTARRVAVYCVSLDPEPETRRFVADLNLPFPVVRFPERKLARLYRVGRVPLTLVLDHEGEIVHSYSGPLSEGASTDSVVSAIRQATSATAVTDE